MSEKICIFAGTTEGRKLTELLRNSAELTVCVATEYGEVMLEEIEGIRVHGGRMGCDEMAAFFSREGFSRIIDATHPYADVVTENIKAAAERTGIPVIRILRGGDRHISDAVYVASAAEAADYLAKHDGNVLITTGSKEITAYAGETSRRNSAVLAVPLPWWETFRTSAFRLAPLSVIIYSDQSSASPVKRKDVWP